ncbi:helix-turn-helix domain-containing protein [Psychrobacter sp. I-STPA10]|uniref:helix-turn-helix domain-containing protein n=1 Tax=Psychrobacter sp. I-STPA10 TaxID=2585769 RepID=UPI001E5E3B1F|nr:RodZ domain-containing protein [Psychrobacter sp. I-STPA10]
MQKSTNQHHSPNQPSSSVEQAETLLTGNKMSEALSNTDSRSFGATLKWAREQKNCTLDEAADHLHILKRHLEALEAEDFAVLPQMTFARGFAINYAKYLGLDTNAIVKSFDAVYPEHLKSSVGNIKTPLKPLGTLQRDSRRPSFRINPFLILFVIALIALAVFLLRTVNNARQETAVDPQDEIAINNISSSEQAQGAALTTATDAAVTATGSALDIANTGSAIATTETTVAQADANLDFWVRDNTDITVTDATGAVLLSGDQPRGGYKIKGQPPFQVQINNVKNVTLNLNQVKVPLADYAQNDQANFSLAP